MNLLYDKLINYRDDDYVYVVENQLGLYVTLNSKLRDKNDRIILRGLVRDLKLIKTIYDIEEFVENPKKFIDSRTTNKKKK